MLDLEWLVEGQILLARYSQNVTLEDIQKGIAFADEFAKASPERKLYLIIDNTQIQKHDFNVFDLVGMFPKIRQSPPPVAYVVIIKTISSPAQSVIRMMNLLIAQFTGIRFTMVDSVPNAVTFLQAVDGISSQSA